MAEYIEREKMLAEFIEGDNDDDFTIGYNFAVNEYRDKLKAMPAADVQPIKKGHWYHNTSKYVSELDAYFIQARCSCCCRYNDRIDQYSQVMSNEHCSYCGADMRTVPDADAGEIANVVEFKKPQF